MDALAPVLIEFLAPASHTADPAEAAASAA
jgi:hypothetical protein